MSGLLVDGGGGGGPLLEEGNLGLLLFIEGLDCLGLLLPNGDGTGPFLGAENLLGPELGVGALFDRGAPPRPGGNIAPPKHQNIF